MLELSIYETLKTKAIKFGIAETPLAGCHVLIYFSTTCDFLL